MTKCQTHIVRANPCFGLLFIFLLALGCSRNSFEGELTGGGGIEDGNAEIQGLILDEEGNPIEGAGVTLAPKGYNAYTDSLPEEWQVISDKDGAFQIGKVDSGDYNLIIIDSASGKKTLYSDITLLEDKDTVIDIDELSLQEPGTLQISLLENDVSLGYLFVPGTDVYILVDSNVLNDQQVLIPGIPDSQNVSVVFQGFEDTDSTILLAESLLVTSGEDLQTDPYKNWMYSKKVTLPTGSKSSVPIEERQIEFPILIRITAEKFDFTTFSTTGEDFRFLNKKGKPLPFHFEEYDLSNSSALAWILLDTLFQNNDSQFVEIKWGYRYANENPAGNNVFDTSNGFAGVWHLNEKGSTLENGFKDQTLNGNHGTGVKLNDTLTVDGVVGSAIKFTGDSQSVKIVDHSSLDLEQFTLSAWVNIEDTSGRIIDKMTNGEGDGYRMDVLRERLRLCRCRDENEIDSISRIINKGSNVIIPINNFVHVAITFNHGLTNFYLNGVLADSTELIKQIPTNDLDVYIGGGANQRKSYKGIIDEVRISNLPRSEDWIKVSFENQKIGSTWPIIP